MSVKSVKTTYAQNASRPHASCRQRRLKKKEGRQSKLDICDFHRLHRRRRRHQLRGWGVQARGASPGAGTGTGSWIAPSDAEQGGCEEADRAPEPEGREEQPPAGHCRSSRGETKRSPHAWFPMSPHKTRPPSSRVAKSWIATIARRRRILAPWRAQERPGNEARTCPYITYYHVTGLR